MSDMTNLRILQVVEGINALDGIRTAPDAFEPFQFDADTTWALALNHTILAAKLEPFDRAKKALAAQYGIKDRMPIDQNNPELMKRVNSFVEGLDSLNEKVSEVSGLVKIPRAKLNIGAEKGQNRIPLSVITKIMPLIE